MSFFSLQLQTDFGSNFLDVKLWVRVKAWIAAVHQNVRSGRAESGEMLNGSVKPLRSDSC